VPQGSWVWRRSYRYSSPHFLHSIHFACFGEPVSPHLLNLDGASDWLTVLNLMTSSSGRAEWLLEASSAIQSQTLRSNAFGAEYLGKFRGGLW